MLFQLQVGEPLAEVPDGLLHQIGDAHARNHHIASLLAEPSAVAFRTDGPSAVSTEHHPVLDFVLVFLHHLEEGVNRHPVVGSSVMVGWQTVPKPVFLFAGEFEIRLEDGEIVFCRPSAELVLPHLHLLAMPALHAAIVDAERGVGNHQFLIDTDHAAVSLAHRAGSHR